MGTPPQQAKCLREPFRARCSTRNNNRTSGEVRLLVRDDSEADSELIERAQRGDAAAFESLVRRYQEVAFRVAYTITGSAADAEDATQDGFVRAYHALGRFRRGAPLRPWLLTIVANAARTRRTVAARHPTLTFDTPTVHGLHVEVPSPEHEAIANEQRRELLRAIGALRDDDQHVIAFRYFLDLSEPEMAEVLGCARGTVKSRLSRALGRLRIQLASAAGVAPEEGGHD